MKLGVPAKGAERQKRKSRHVPVKTGNLKVRTKASKKAPMFVSLVLVMLVASFTLLAIHPPNSINGTISADQTPREDSAPVTKDQTDTLDKPASDAKNYFSDILSKSNTSGFKFTGSDLNLSSNSDFSKELSSSYGTSSFCNYGCHVYDSSGNYVTITCYGTTNSCTTYSSSGATINTYCSSYINSCSSYSSSGDSYNTTCSNYTNNCNTTGSDGYSSNTSCSKYTNSCSTYSSDGGYSNTYCSQYTSSCSTYGSDGSNSTTYCSRYTSSCTTY